MEQFLKPVRQHSFDNQFLNNNIKRFNSDNGNYHLMRRKSLEDKEVKLKVLNPFYIKSSSYNYDNSTKPKGLDNIGATCYMNATLQCFYHCKKLTNYFLSGKYESDEITIPENSITNEYIKLVKQLNVKDGKQSYAPYDFKKILGEKNPLFKGVAANDSKDLILFLEEELSNDLAIKKNNLKRSYDFSINDSLRRSYDFSVDQTDEKQTLNAALNDFSRVTSIIKDIFYFMIKTTSVCKNCNAKIYNFQVMNFIIFPLEKTYKDSKNTINSMITSNLNNMNNNETNYYKSNRIKNNNNNLFNNNMNTNLITNAMKYNMNTNMYNMNYNMNMNNMINNNMNYNLNMNNMNNNMNNANMNNMNNNMNNLNINNNNMYMNMKNMNMNNNMNNLNMNNINNMNKNNMNMKNMNMNINNNTNNFNMNNINNNMNMNYNMYTNMNNINNNMKYNMNTNMNNNMNNINMNNIMNINNNQMGYFNTPKMIINPFLNNNTGMNDFMNIIMNRKMNINSSPNLSYKRLESLDNNNKIFNSPTSQNLYNNRYNFNNNYYFNLNNNFQKDSMKNEREKEMQINIFRKNSKRPENNFANNAENLYFGNYHSNKKNYIFNNNNFINNYNNNNLLNQKNDFFNMRNSNNNNQFNLLGSGGGGPYDNYLNENKTKQKEVPKITLDQCFESYLQPENMTGDNKQFCNKCGTLSDSVYSTYIYSSPNILILILNYGKGILFECDVQFDEYINISKYINSKPDKVPTRYRLLGAIVHIGPSNMGGHFISYCRSIENKDKWFELNDAMVSESSFSEIKKRGIPYVLFYENVENY